jgi:uncharacterized repeat protein (TIGR03803 family)
MSDPRSLFNRTDAKLVMLAAVVGLFVIAIHPLARAQTESVLHTFCSQGSCADGALPYGNLVMDAAGNIYGTTTYGGTHDCGYPFLGCGVAFELTLGAVETVRKDFNWGYDSFPVGSLILDAKGNLYGATVGTDYPGMGSFLGSVFKLEPRSFGYLYRFSDLSIGALPNSGFAMDREGNLYGTTQYGGANGCGTGWGCGTVFKLTPKGELTVLYSFAGAPDGESPNGGLVLDSEGNVYGTTAGGGAINRYCAAGSSCGTVFKVAPSGAETILYTFQGGNDGGNPVAGLVIDKRGNLYGTTEIGGSSTNNGTVFKVTPGGKETILHSFAGGMDGSLPSSSVTLDGKGNLYGTTGEGGGSGCYESAGCGTVFEISPSGTTILYRFTGGADGAFPDGGLVLDGKGNLYGTTVAGGGTQCQSFYSNTGCGVVFKLTP